MPAGQKLISYSLHIAVIELNFKELVSEFDENAVKGYRHMDAVLGDGHAGTTCGWECCDCSCIDLNRNERLE